MDQILAVSRIEHPVLCLIVRVVSANRDLFELFAPAKRHVSDLLQRSRQLHRFQLGALEGTSSNLLHAVGDQYFDKAGPLKCANPDSLEVFGKDDFFKIIIACKCIIIDFLDGIRQRY